MLYLVADILHLPTYQFTHLPNPRMTRFSDDQMI